MNRRDLLKSFGAIALYGSLPSVMSEFVVSCEAAERIKPLFFSAGEFAVLENAVDVLLPRTKTPGGLDTQTPAFIDRVIKDCLGGEDQKLVRKGLNDLMNSGGKSFLKRGAAERTALIKSLDEKAFTDDEESVWWRIVKKFALVGYFTSQGGMTKALRYLKVPGDFEGCIPYEKGEKAMAKTFLIYW